MWLSHRAVKVYFLSGHSFRFFLTGDWCACSLTFRREATQETAWRLKKKRQQRKNEQHRGQRRGQQR